VFSIVSGIIADHLPHVLRREALDELARRMPPKDFEHMNQPLPPPVAWQKPNPFLFQLNTELSGVVEPCFDTVTEMILKPIVIANRRHLRELDSMHLSNEAGLSRQYQQCIDAVDYYVHRDKYQVGNRYADMALRLRPLSVDYQSLSQCQYLKSCSHYGFDLPEEAFADSLISLGRYAEAKNVLLGLPPIEKMPTIPWSNPGPFIGYRRTELCEAYLGLKKYRNASCELEKPIPSLAESNSTNEDLDVALLVAYLAQRRDKAAVQVYSRWKRRAGSTSFELPTLLTQIPGADHATAIRIAHRVIEYCYPPDPSTAPCLDFASSIMESYKHSAAASILSAEANRIRQQ